MHVSPKSFSSEHIPTVEDNRGVLSSSWPLKWLDEGHWGGGVKGGRETWAKVKKANLFPVSPCRPWEADHTLPIQRGGFNVVKGA